MVSASHRLQTPEPQVETKVEMPRVEEKLEMPREGREVRRPSGVQREIRPTSEGSTRVVPRSLREPVQEILAPAPQPDPQALPLTPFPVPKTVSNYDDSIDFDAAHDPITAISALHFFEQKFFHIVAFRRIDKTRFHRLSARGFFV